MTGTRIATRLIHGVTALLTLLHLVWVDAPSCCCAKAPCGRAGVASCCGGDPNRADCGCCCQRDASAPQAEQCPHCAPAQVELEPSCCSTSLDAARDAAADAAHSCGAPGSCNCGKASERSTAPSTQTTSTSQTDVGAPFAALDAPPLPDLLPAVSIERRNGDLAALERPVTIRFGVWRN